jgi:hypothetical protein
MECCVEMIAIATRRAPGTCKIEIAGGSAAEERRLEVVETGPDETDRADCKRDWVWGMAMARDRAGRRVWWIGNFRANATMAWCLGAGGMALEMADEVVVAVGRMRIQEVDRARAVEIAGHKNFAGGRRTTKPEPEPVAATDSEVESAAMVVTGDAALHRARPKGSTPPSALGEPGDSGSADTLVLLAVPAGTVGDVVPGTDTARQVGAAVEGESGAVVALWAGFVDTTERSRRGLTGPCPLPRKGPDTHETEAGRLVAQRTACSAEAEKGWLADTPGRVRTDDAPRGPVEEGTSCSARVYCHSSCAPDISELRAPAGESTTCIPHHWHTAHAERTPKGVGTPDPDCALSGAHASVASESGMRRLGPGSGRKPARLAVPSWVGAVVSDQAMVVGSESW